MIVFKNTFQTNPQYFAYYFLFDKQYEIYRKIDTKQNLAIWMAT